MLVLIPELAGVGWAVFPHGRVVCSHSNAISGIFVCQKFLFSVNLGMFGTVILIISVWVYILL